MSKIKVMIADDHPAFREGLYRLLDDEEDMEVVARPADGEEAVYLTKELQPDVVIMDVAIPKLNGIDAATQIKETCQNISILIVSAYDYESYMLTALQVGAAGYPLKSAPLSDLINAICFVHAGEGVFDFKVGSNILHRLASKSGKGAEFVGLSHRELQVLKLGAKGLSNKDIASELVLSERTIQTHLVNIFKKLEVSSRTEAVLSAIREGWLTLDDLP